MQTTNCKKCYQVIENSPEEAEKHSKTCSANSAMRVDCGYCGETIMSGIIYPGFKFPMLRVIGGKHACGECERIATFALLHPETDKEIVICAAIKMDDGYIIRGHRHSDSLHTAAGIPRYKGNSHAWGENQGFVTSKGRYVDRIEGAQLQKAAGIKSKMPEGQEYLHGQLYSEDLY